MNPARDGSIGSKTLQAVKEYQPIGGLAVDGRVGKKTWSRLCNSGAYWGDNTSPKRAYLGAARSARAQVIR
jgi:peptidoglycan hydrolase-like protein with peptidoglycan-binding domain